MTGALGLGKSALVINRLTRALQNALRRIPHPAQVVVVGTAGIRQVHAVGATPINRNGRSPLATCSGVFDPIRKLFAATPKAMAQHFGLSHFSYNTTDGWCPTCHGTGSAISARIADDLPRLQRQSPCSRGRAHPLERQDHCRCVDAWLRRGGGGLAAPAVDPPHLAGDCRCDVALGEATPHLSGGGGTAPAAGRADTPPSGQRAAHL